MTREFAKANPTISQRKKWAWRLAREVAKIWGLPFNISTMAETSDVKFGMPLGFVKVHLTITPRRKTGRGVWLRKLPKIWGYL